MTASDLKAYFERVGHSGGADPDLATLKALHRAHVRAIPFENLEIQTGGSITLDAGTLLAKMVRRRRGGYCFEQNTLFKMVLESIGFKVTPREARVRQQAAGTVRPRTHMVLITHCEKREWLVDVGFGGDGLVEPIGLDGAEMEQAGALYRVVYEDRVAVLQRSSKAGWEDLYAVQPNDTLPIDCEVGNWYTSTHPHSPFVLNVTAQRVIHDTRHSLRNLTYSIANGDEIEVREIRREELVPLLRDVFDLDVPEDARFRALDS